MEIIPGKEYIIVHNPNFSSINRVGLIVKGVQKNGYMAVEDKLGVSWSPSNREVEEIKK